MPFLGFTGTYPVTVPYSELKKLATGTGFGSSTLRAANNAAGYGISRAAGWLGLAGAFGFFVGQKILEGLEYTEQPLTIRQLYKTAGNQGKIRVLATVTLQGVGVLNFDNLFDSPVVMPVALDGTGGTFRYGALVGANATFVGYFQAAPDQMLSPFRVTSLTKEGGAPAAFQQIPAPAFPIIPYAPIKVPALVPTAPGEPDFPITPTVVPTPENDPDKDNEAGEPGVIVQIPEVGLQLRYSPTGVAIARYTSPETRVFEEPKVPPPPNTPTPAVNVCPCPENDVDLSEVICRLKALENGLLSDGYDYTTTAGASGQGGVISDIADELVYVEIQIDEFAPYERTQRSAPGTPTVYFIGWFSWIVGQFPSERIPISYLNHNFIAPPNATGYLYSLHDGASAITRYVTRTAKEYTDLC